MLIGELVRRSGLTRDAIRFYERKGLIRLHKKQRRDNNYKEYPEQLLDRLSLIRTIKGFGFTISEIKSLFGQLEEGGRRCNLEDTIVNKVDQIDKEIKRLTEIRESLVSSMDSCRAGNCQFRKAQDHPLTSKGEP